MDGRRVFSTVAWYVILAAVIYFLDIQILNILALIFASFLVSGSILDRNDKKMLVFKLILTVLLIVVYCIR